MKAVVALDHAYHQGGPSAGEEPVIRDPETEGVGIAVPTSIQGAPASNCNSEGDYAEITLQITTPISMGMRPMRYRRRLH